MVGPAQSSRATVARWTLVLLRVYLGAAFIRAATNKIGENWKPWPGWMADFITSQLPHSAPVYRTFLTAVVVPHTAVFAPAVACTEVVVGCCLVLGFATRGMAGLGAFLALNYLLMKGGPLLLPNNDPVFVLGCLTLSIGAAGRALGVDYWLHRKWPRLPVS